MPQFLCWTGEEFVQFLLTIGGVCPHITQVALIPPEQATRVILLRFEGTIERQSTAGAELALELLQDRTCGKAKVEIEGANLLRLQIVGAASAQIMQCDRSIDIVENFDRPLSVDDLVCGADSLGEE